MSDTLRDILEEADRAQVKYGSFTSTHESLGVLTEEYLELIDAIRRNDPVAVRREAIQVAAVALRLADEGSPEFTKRSGF